MRIKTTLFLFVILIGHNIGSERDVKKGIQLALSLFRVFDDNYREAVVNRDQCQKLNDQAKLIFKPYHGMLFHDVMSVKDIDENFVCFCSAAPEYNLRKLTAEWLFSSIFVQYSAIQAIFSMTVCRVYNLYALETPNQEQADNCAKVASYLNAFRSIVFADRMFETTKIYEHAGMLGKLSSIMGSSRFEQQQVKGFNIVSQLQNLIDLDVLLNRLSDIIEVEGSKRVPRVSCDGTLFEEHHNIFPLAMHLDFYINANMDDEKKPPQAFETIEEKYGYTRSKSNAPDAYQKLYYRQAWFDIFYIFYIDFFPMINYFNNVLYGDEPILITSGVFEPFLPPFEESLKVWAKAGALRRITEIDNYEDNRSKVIKILREILMTNAPRDDGELIKPAKIKVSYTGYGEKNIPDFSLNLI